MYRIGLIPTTVALCLAAPPVMAAATADVMNAEGNPVGTVNVEDTASGTALVSIELNDMPEGEHAVHFHETGDCSANDFGSAGGHVPGDADHGVRAEGGPHPGDLPNVTVASDGVVSATYFNSLIDIDDQLLDDDGAAFIVHSGADDYSSQPSGAAGDRIACGVFSDDEA